MSLAPNGSQHGGPRPPRAPTGARRTRDRRRTQIVWVPTYLPDYTERVGANGITMYLLLARACCYGWEPRWPSLAQLGKMMGVSRSTAERTLRVLRHMGLIETEACYDELGQHSNYWDLTDPYDIREQLDSPGTDVAGAVIADVGPPSLLTGGDGTDDGGAPAPMTAPIVKIQEGSKSVCAEDTLTPTSALQPAIPEDIVRRLSAQWDAQLQPGNASWRQTQRDEFRFHAWALLHRGWTEEELTVSILDPARSRGEWPREWAARHGLGALQEARKALDAEKTRHKHAQTLSEGRKEVARRLAVKARYDALSDDRRAELTGQVLAKRPELATRPGILDMLASELLDAEHPAQVPPE